MLYRIAAALKAITGSNGYAARIGGDEFAAAEWFEYCTEEEKLHSRADEICERIHEALRNDSCPVSVSLGATAVHVEEKEFNEIYSSASRAMYEAKKSQETDRLCRNRYIR